jgi:membrane protease YdiL (CAAX protease family)
MKKRLFLILFLLGFAGVLSFLLVDLAALVASFPLPAGTVVPVITPTFKLLSLVQPTVLVLVAVLLGVALAPKVGLTAPVAESLAAGRSVLPSLRPQLLPGVLGSVVGGVSILLIAAVLKPFLTTDTIARISKLGTHLPMTTRLLYGGLTEEVLLRWGFMTLLVWITWRLFQKRLAKPTSVCFIVAILISSIVFGLGHLPVAILLLPKITVAVVLFVILANSAFGIVAGYLYWKRGLESAMIAHMLCHVVLVTANRAGSYF